MEPWIQKKLEPSPGISSLMQKTGKVTDYQLKFGSEPRRVADEVSDEPEKIGT